MEGRGLKFAWKKRFFLREKTFAFLKLSTISREKTFAFCCFEISKGIDFREKGPKTRKTRKFLPAKVSAHKVVFPSIDSRDHRESKIIYTVVKIRSLKKISRALTCWI